MKTGYLTTTKYSDPSFPVKVRFWHSKEEAQEYKTAITKVLNLKVDLKGPVEIDLSKVDRNGYYHELPQNL